MITKIRISRKLVTQLLHLAQISPEKEICGLLSSKSGVPIRCYPIDNIATEPKNHFLLDAKQHIEAIKQIREQGETLFAIYHSHPSSPAEPSTLDLDIENYVNVLCFIISLNTKGVLELRAFSVVHQTITEVPIGL